MIDNMQPGSIIYDLAASQGGNAAYTKPDEIIENNGITIIGDSTILNKLPTSASNLYAKNLFNFVLNLYDKNNNKININNMTNLRGKHNWQNAGSAYVVLKEFGLSNHEIKKSFASFKGLPHRLESVYKDGFIEYINDSKATNVFATAYALNSFSSIFWILGGKSKGEKLDPLFPFLHRVEHAFTIGESGKLFADKLMGKVNVSYVISLENAFESALEIIQKSKIINNAVILFSPACSSFDQYKNFEERGNKFREIVFKYVGKKNA